MALSLSFLHLFSYIMCFIGAKNILRKTNCEEAYLTTDLACNLAWWCHYLSLAPEDCMIDITLDPNTAHPRLVISVDGKQVFCGEKHQVVPDSPELNRVVCALAREGFDCGRHYWEVGRTDWDLGIASRSVCRKGKITVSPAHGYWFLSLRDQTDYAFRTDASRIGVFLDYEKGIVSFYNVDAKVLMYTFNARFTDVILPFFSPCTNKSGKNEAPLIICPVSTIE
uniref:B30.2/SPRY domain-containing protein n=1 Tax=Periophthalmus magnuspinnatus TaxID=409849 RepID=A0A3B4B9E0_9GOBI